VALLAAGAIVWSKARGLPWLGWTVAAGLLSVLLGVSLVQRLRRAHAGRETRWETALYAPDERPRAIQQLRRALRRLEPVKPRTRSEHTRLSLLLADLLDASGACAEASAVVASIPLSTLTPLEAGLVRHTHAVTRLRAADADGALAVLDGREASGDVELDQRLSLLETYARLELGDPARALSFASELEGTRGIDDSVALEARVVRAAALDALGRREEALVALAALGRDSLVPLADLGQPRVRTLAKVVLEGFEE
jgi:hypothetical protein